MIIPNFYKKTDYKQLLLFTFLHQGHGPSERWNGLGYTVAKRQVSWCPFRCSFLCEGVTHLLTPQGHCNVGKIGSDFKMGALHIYEQTIVSVAQVNKKLTPLFREGLWRWSSGSHSPSRIAYSLSPRLRPRKREPGLKVGSVYKLVSLKVRSLLPVYRGY